MKQLLSTLSFFLVISLLTGSLNDLKAQEKDQPFTIYLVRHAEKDLTSNSGGDPALTECGAERAKHLSTFLGHVPLNSVYSTNYVRTKYTALPTAKSKELEVREYSPGELEAFAKLLKEQKEDALVVGHSNTTGVLAGMLVGQDIGSFDEDIYNRIYQVVIHNDKARLHLFHTAFSCSD